MKALLQDWKPRLALLAAGAAAAALYWPSLGHGFVNWDDDLLILENLGFRGLGLDQLWWMLTSFLNSAYQPLGWLAYDLLYLAGGLDPFLFHFASLAAHSLNAMLFFAVTLHLLRAPGAGGHKDSSGSEGSGAAIGALAASLAFALHPLQVESVAWASLLPDLLSATFALGALLCCLKAQERPPAAKRGMMLLAVCLFAASGLCRWKAAALPLILILLDVHPLRRLPADPRRWGRGPARAVVIEKIPFLIVAAAVVGLNILAKSGGAHAMGLWPGEIGDKIMFFLHKTLRPLALVPIYTRGGPEIPSAVPVIGNTGFVLALTAALLFWRRRWPSGLAAWLCYLALILPILGASFDRVLFVNDRYAYLSCMGFFVLFGGGIARLWASKWARRPAARIAAAAAVLLVAALLGGLSRAQLAVWRDSESLVDPHSERQPRFHQRPQPAGLGVLQAGKIQ